MAVSVVLFLGVCLIALALVEQPQTVADRPMSNAPKNEPSASSTELPAATLEAHSEQSVAAVETAARDVTVPDPAPVLSTARARDEAFETKLETQPVAKEIPAPPAPPPSDVSASPDPSTTGGTPADYGLAKEDEPDNPRLTPQERKRQVAENRLRKLVQDRFESRRRANNRYARVSPDDWFIVANYEMPLQTRVADVRFAVSEGLAPSVERISDYLASTPRSSVRDFQVIARFATLEDAENGILVVRRRYDEMKKYQAQLMEYLRQQQRIQARAMRRC